jgi:CheY-like chemotaxis protein
MSIQSRPEFRPTSSHKLGPILVVDNDPTSVEILNRILSREGYQVVTTLSGADVLRLVKEMRPFAITLDLDMPDLDGWAVLKSLKADAALATIPVIIVSTIDERTRGIASGAADYMVKPVDRTRLLGLVKRLHGGTPSTAAPPSRGAAPAGSVGGGAGPSKQAPRVLIVEDDDNNRYLLARNITRQGWTSIEAANGREGLEAIALSKPDLILLDLEMPELNGFDFLRELHRSPALREIPIIVITAIDLTASDRQLLGETVRKVFLKAHYSRDDLLRELRSQLESPGKS